MKLITIQHTAVLAALMQGKTYHADYNRVPSNLKVPYQKMADFYGWKTCPVFGCVIGKPSYFCGCGIDNVTALELNVPDDIVKMQYFYDWTDFAYFTEFPDEYSQTFDTNIYPTIDDYAVDMFSCKNLGSYNIFQATIPCIKPKWLTDSSSDCITYLTNCDDVFSGKVLSELKNYKPS